MTIHPVVTPDEWLAARKALLAAEKAHTRQKDLVSQKRRELPWVRVDTNYVFDGPDGPVPLPELFQGRSQLVVQHFMFDPAWDEGCVGCSLLADHVDDAFQHLYHHDVSFVAVSRAPLDTIQPFKERMGWTFTWVSSFNNDFNRDFGVTIFPEDVASGRSLFARFSEVGEGDSGEVPGVSIFTRDDAGTVYHTYSTFGADDVPLLNVYNLLDIAPLGRNEREGPMSWVRHHDRYEAGQPEGI